MWCSETHRASSILIAFSSTGSFLHLKAQRCLLFTWTSSLSDFGRLRSLLIVMIGVSRMAFMVRKNFKGRMASGYGCSNDWINARRRPLDSGDGLGTRDHRLTYSLLIYPLTLTRPPHFLVRRVRCFDHLQARTRHLEIFGPSLLGLTRWRFLVQVFKQVDKWVVILRSERLWVSVEGERLEQDLQSLPA